MAVVIDGSKRRSAELQYYLQSLALPDPFLTLVTSQEPGTERSQELMALAQLRCRWRMLAMGLGKGQNLYRLSILSQFIKEARCTTTSTKTRVFVLESREKSKRLGKMLNIFDSVLMALATRPEHEVVRWGGIM